MFHKIIAVVAGSAVSVACCLAGEEGGEAAARRRMEDEVRAWCQAEREADARREAEAEARTQRHDEAFRAAVELFRRGQEDAGLAAIRRSYDDWRRAAPAERGCEFGQFNEMVGMLFNGDERDERLAEPFLRLALAHADEMPIDDEFDFISRLMPPRGELPAAEYAARRAEAMPWWCHYLARLQRQVESLRAGRPAVLPVPREPASFSDSVLGTATVAERIAYEAALEKQGRSMRAAFDWDNLRRAVESLQVKLPRFEAAIVGAYARPPYATEDMRRLLRESGVDDATRERIEAGVLRAIAARR